MYVYLISEHGKSVFTVLLFSMSYCTVLKYCLINCSITFTKQSSRVFAMYNVVDNFNTEIY